MTRLRHAAHRRARTSPTPSSCPSSTRRGRSRSTSTGRMIGMRYPYEVNLVGDAAATLRALIPLLERKDDRSWQRDDRATKVDALVGGHGRRGPRVRRPDQPDADLQRVLRRGSARRDHRRRQRLGGQLVRPAGPDARRDARHASPAPWPPWGRRCPTPSAPSSPIPTGRPIAFEGDGAMQMNGLAELITIARYWQRWTRPPAGRRGPAQQRPQPGHLGAARHGRHAEVRRVPGTSRRVLRRLRRVARPGRAHRDRPRGAGRRVEDRARRRPALRPRHPLRPGHPADPAARRPRADAGRRPRR